jgi:proline iminopeptidase
MLNVNAGEIFSEEFVQINEIRQYFQHYQKDSDSVVLFLHGGMTEAHFSYKTVLRDRVYSFVYYDQRGTGKTQSMNQSKPNTVTLETLLCDLDETVNYIRKAYPNKRLILLGHSRGSVLGMEYVKRHSAKIDAYVGMGQLIDFKAGLQVTADYGLTSADDRDRKRLEELRAYSESHSPDDLAKACIGLEKLQTKYKLAGLKRGSFALIKTVIGSPVFALTDIKSILSALRTNVHLFPCVGGCDFRSQMSFSIPVYFICGKDDWQAPGAVVAQYCDTVTAPGKQLYWIEGAGHFTNLDAPDACTAVLNEICSSLQSK